MPSMPLRTPIPYTPRRWAPVLALLFCLALFAAPHRAWAQATPDAIVGTWLIEKQTARIEIYKKNNHYFGRVAWLKVPNDPETHQPKTDRRNPNVKLRKRPVLGMLIIGGLKYDPAKEEWNDGVVYDPEGGKLYDCVVLPDGPNRIKVRGFWGMIFKTEVWERVR